MEYNYKGRSIRSKKDSRVGLRVEVPAFSDTWMRGARFGEIRSVIASPGTVIPVDLLFIKMDNARIRKHLCFKAKDCNILEVAHE